ncbi:transcriptional regulator swi6 [Elasticomyces elasticus]|nr:transcriptional regulator swi6 [Elasticomyces elasticus]KAK4971274.1 transcriptional regulator swi6 [Elasticomyces elasticus]
MPDPGYYVDYARANLDLTTQLAPGAMRALSLATMDVPKSDAPPAYTRGEKPHQSPGIHPVSGEAHMYSFPDELLEKPHIYTAVYSGVSVYEMDVQGIACMRRRSDGWLNATQILKVAGVDKGKRTKVLEKEILTGEHEIVQGSYGKYQGTWITYRRGREFCHQYGVEDILRPLLDYGMSADYSNLDVIPDQRPSSGSVLSEDNRVEKHMSTKLGTDVQAQQSQMSAIQSPKEAQRLTARWYQWPQALRLFAFDPVAVHSMSAEWCFLRAWRLKSLLRPRTRRGFRRFEWTCTCGKSLYGDYAVTDEQSARSFEEFLSSFASAGANMPSGNLAGQGAAAASNSGVAGTGSSSTRPAPAACQSQAAGPNSAPNTATVTTLGFPDDRPAFFELCVRQSSHITRLGEICLSDGAGRRIVRSDADLFSLIRQRYNKLRRKGLYRFLRKPVSIHYVLFSIIRGDTRIGIHEQPMSLPPPIEVQQLRYHYDCGSMKTLPPMAAQTFFHYLWDHVPAPHCDVLQWFYRLPKKLGTSLLQLKAPHEVSEGWGVMIVEGPNKAALAWLVTASLLMSLMFGVVYDVVIRNKDSGFAVAQWMVAVLASAITAVYFHLAED